MTKLTYTLSLFLLSFAGSALVAHAQGYVPLAALPGTTIDGGNTTDLPTYISGAIKLIIALGAGLAFLFAVIGGTQYVASSINVAAKGEALERIQRSLIGLAIILSSYLILNSINPRLVSFNLSIKEVTPGTLDTTPPPTPSYLPTDSTYVHMAVSALQLQPNASSVANAILAKYPSVVFTSGKRSMDKQREAMAKNVAGTGGRSWIKNTYKSSLCVTTLQKAVDDHPETTTWQDLSTLFAPIMNPDPTTGYDTYGCKNISSHTAGLAFDIAPLTTPDYPTEADVKAMVENAGGTFLGPKQEGGVNVWHSQFKSNTYEP